MSDKYLDDDELAMLAGLFRDPPGSAEISLAITMDAALQPLLAQAASMELKIKLNGTLLSFPVKAGNLWSQNEEAQLSTPEIISAGTPPRAWRLPAPRGLRLHYCNGKQVLAEIRDMSVNGMKLLSRRSLFTGEKTCRQVQLLLAREHKIPLELHLVRQHKGSQFWLTTVHFELDMAERLALSEFVFRGFLEEMGKRQEQP